MRWPGHRARLPCPPWAQTTAAQEGNSSLLAQFALAPALSTRRRCHSSRFPPVAPVNTSHVLSHPAIEEWPNSDSEDDSDLMIDVTSVLHEDSEAQIPQWKGSVLSRANNLDHNREAGHVQLYNDYFHPELSLYGNYFQLRFRMSRKLFG
jgi:hypothetical protein